MRQFEALRGARLGGKKEGAACSLRVTTIADVAPSFLLCSLTIRQREAERPLMEVHFFATAVSPVSGHRPTRRIFRLKLLAWISVALTRNAAHDSFDVSQM